MWSTRPTSALCASTTTCTDPNDLVSLEEMYGIAEIDYSAANEYLDEQYENKIPNPYFPETKKTELIYNGRRGFLVDKHKDDYGDDNISCTPDAAPRRRVSPTLETCGFCLEHLPAPPQVHDWNNKEALREYYLPELRNYFEQTYGADNILHLYFYNPMVRGRDLEAVRKEMKNHELPTSPTQSKAHLDNDWPASDLDRVVGLVHKQSLDYYDAQDQFPREQLKEAVRKGHRFMVVNCWRNVNRQYPIQQAPLGVYATQYAGDRVFPEVTPDFNSSRWYVFPHMTADECLLFKQFDRNKCFSSDIWHCALHTLKSGQKKPPSTLKPVPRKSFDIRAFLVLKDKVDAKHDRYGSNRLEPKYKTAEEHQAATS